MLLCIDVGNSMTHYALFEGGALVQKAVVAAGDPALPPFVSRASGVERVAVASVAPGRAEAVREAVRRETGVEPLLAGKDFPIPVEARVEHPERVGADRLLNALAAFHRMRSACVVVDAGTAVTVDLVDGEGAFLGGAIAPGPKMMLAAMSQGAELLPEIEFAQPTSSVGRNTADAMRAGVFWGFVGLVDRLAREVAEASGTECRVVGAGGWMGLLAPRLPMIETVAPDLTLEGLALAVAEQ